MTLFSTVASCQRSATARRSPTQERDIVQDHDIDDPALQKWLEEAVKLSSQPRLCPSSCTKSTRGTEAAGQFLFSDASQLTSCNETMIISFNVASSDHEENMTPGIWACTADYEATTAANLVVPNSDKAALCSTPNHVISNTTARISHINSKRSERIIDSNVFVSVTQQVARHLASRTPSCNESTIAFGYSETFSIGIFSGVEVHQHGVILDVLNNILTSAIDTREPTVVQVCTSGQRGADYTVGIAIAPSEDLTFVRNAVKAWADGECVTPGSGERDLMPVALRVPPRAPSLSRNINGTVFGNETTNISSHIRRSRLTARGDCTTAKVNAGEGCFDIAQRCGISQAKLEEYNPRDHFCNTLVKDETVCCSAGTLPEHIPNGNSDGTCVLIDAKPGDTCVTLAQKCGLEVKDFEKSEREVMRLSTSGRPTSLLHTGQDAGSSTKAEQ